MRAAAALVVAGTLLLGACTGVDQPDEPASSPSPEAKAEAPTPPPPPERDACYRLDYDEAIATSNDASPVPCRRRHTARTVAVGDGRRAARECPRRFSSYVGGSTRDRRLSMLRPVWFTPTEEARDAGASWWRCDAVALAGHERLADLRGELRGALGRPKGRDRYGMCGTAEPGTARFERVICSTRHTWRAVDTVPFEQASYPGVDEVRSAGDEPCRDAGAEAADGALDYRWGYEWPSAEQWRDGQHYGICWAPS
ncbi:septum formation family protein [Nocardioides sp. YIM 152315]|uniref:septum formation family protein n=1 Tax=Nocardioides sp. YIM 152315 TaxID=3031760 RepID=UPI0023DB7343|nr:septum formation family protein [Nocardioides sp. YIM 152315]MDF1603853.1 septum formation family protein [Nocardioides sp. YIM 152315]